MLLTAEGLHKQFGSKELFRIPSFVIRQGDSIYLEGENGAGKTTLMKIFAGLERPTSGRVRYGVNTGHWWRKGHSEVVYLHQSPFLFSGTVTDNIAYGLKLRIKDATLIKRFIAHALEASQLEHLADQDAKTLSGGERQRLALARAAVLHPKVLLLDEPTANLDQDSIAIVSDMIAGLVSEGCAILLSSHQKTDLTRMCKRRLQLKSGQLLELIDNPEFSRYAS